MSDLEQLKEIIRRSSELSKSGRNGEALSLLEESLKRAMRQREVQSTRILSQHAAVISDAIGDPERMTHFYELLLASSPDDPMALYGMATALRRRGETERAKEYATKSLKALRDSEPEMNRALIEMILDSWPEIKQD
jgi:tetratricopeptide (TPR) repeat protein